MNDSHEKGFNGCISVGKSKAEFVQQHSSRTLLVLFVSLLLDLLGFTVILPLLPSLLEYYGNQDDKQASLYYTLKGAVDGFRDFVGAPDTPRWNSVLFGGMLGSMFSFLQYLTSPFIGAMSDVYGRKPVMILTSLGIAVSYAVWALSHNFTIFVIARIIGGMSKGNISLSYAIVSDVTSAEKRTRGMALIGVAFSVGFLAGPLIGAYFSHRQDLLVLVHSLYLLLCLH
jgi:MFS family permease